MATSLPGRNELAATPDAADKMHVTDTSDTTDGASGTDKWVRYDNVVPAKAWSAPDFGALAAMGANPADTDKFLIYDAAAGAWKTVTASNGSPYRDAAAVVSAVEGTVGTLAKRVYGATVPPASTDDASLGYEPGSVWVDVTNDKAYICVDATASAAIWKELGGGGGTQHVSYTHYCHQGSANYNTMQEQIAFVADAPATFSLGYVTTTKTSGTGTSTSTTYWQFEVFNGGSVSGTNMSSAPFKTHDGTTAHDLADNLDKADLNLNQNLSVAAGDVVTVGITAFSTPASQNTEQLTFHLFYTYD